MEMRRGQFGHRRRSTKPLLAPPPLNPAGRIAEAHRHTDIVMLALGDVQDVRQLIAES